MKRLFIPFVALALAATEMFSGCSCVPTTPLTFNNHFNGEANSVPTVNYSETLVYSVKNINSYADNFSKSEQLNDIISYEMNGEYTMTLKVMDKSEVSETITSDILSDTSINVVYNLKTQLNLQTSYSADYNIYQEDENATPVKEKAFNDVIKTEVYFLESGHSFAPVWSKTEVNSSYLSVNDENKAMIYTLNYSQTIAYDKDEYVITTYNEGTELDPVDYGYTFKTLIDNNMLLFALRNISIEFEKTSSLPTVHATYGDKQTLTVKIEAEGTANDFTITIDGTEQKGNIPVKEYSFVRSDSSNTGLPQYVVLQKSKTEKIAYKAYMLKYVSPLTTYGSFLNMGGLEYTLIEVSH